MNNRMELLEWLANELMNEWDLKSKGWKFQWGNRKRSFGVCRTRSKIIELSTFLLLTIDDNEAENVIRHEIAHALDFEERGTSGHGYKWKAWAIKVGARPERCTTEINEEEYEKLAETTKYTLICPNGHKFPSHRKQKETVESSCYKCCPSHYHEKYRLKQVKNY